MINEPRRWTYDHPDGPRVDTSGVAWYACDPYPTWYRWVDGKLFTSHSPVWPKGER